MILTDETEDRAPFNPAPERSGPAGAPGGAAGGSSLHRAIGALATRRRGMVLGILGVLAAASLTLAYLSRPDRDPATDASSERPSEAPAAPDMAAPASASTTTTPGSTASTIGSSTPGTAQVPTIDLTASSIPTSTASTSTSTSTTATSTSTSTTSGPATSRPASTSATSAPNPTTPTSAAPGTATAPTTTPRTSSSRPATTLPTSTVPTTAPTTARPTTTALGANLLANGSFENPGMTEGYRLGAVASWTSSDSGWIELWRSGYEGVAAAAGNQLAEVNGTRPALITQTVRVTPGATYRWSLQHRGRVDRDTLEVLVDGRLVATLSTDQSWSSYSGEVVAGSASLTLGLRAVDPGSIGNLIDDVRLRQIIEG